MNKYYTYAYLRKDNRPYYIGKGCGNRAYCKNRRYAATPKDKSRIIILKKNLTEAEAYKHERYIIAILGRKDLGTGMLYNLSDGGDGPMNFSEDTRIKLVTSLTGRKRSEKECTSISKGLKGRTRSDKERAAISKGLTGRKLSPESIAKREETKRRKRNERNQTT